MQTSQLISSLLGRPSAVTAAKQVELSPGQVYKGTVMKLYPDNMALVQIGGMQVHAKLETSLEAGQKAWLQVQPSSDMVTLKVLSTDGQAQESADANMEGLLRSLGIKDTAESRAIVQALLQHHQPVSKETVQTFMQLAKRDGMTKELVDAFILAMKRGLPLTKDVVGSLQTFLTSKPLGATMAAFLTQVDQALAEWEQAGETGGKPGQTAPQAGADRQSAASAGGQSPIPSGTPSVTVKETLLQLKEKLSSLPLPPPTDDGLSVPVARDQNVLTPRMNIPGQPLPTVTGPGARLVPEGGIAGMAGNGMVSQEGTDPFLPVNQQMLASKVASGQAGSLPQSAAGGGSGPAGTIPPATVPSVPNSAVPNGQLMPQPSGAGQIISAENSTSMPTAAGTPNAMPGPSAPQPGAGFPPSGQPLPQSATMAAGPQDLAALSQPQPRPELQGQQAESAQRAHPGTAFPAADQSLSADNKKTDLVRDLFRHLGISHERELWGTLAGKTPDPGLSRIDNVKALLLQLTQAPAHAVPGGLKEMAETLLQQVTGQQLLMVQPSHQAISQIVMQVPFQTANGEETAFVQIESQKRDGGKLDPENCRLFFHLDLQQMGMTAIDVAIVNRIINIQVFNDQPWVEQLAGQMRDGLAAHLREAGYTLSNLRVQPVPERIQVPVSGPSKGMLADYKGVDIRV